ncbi:RagB/SusD family nutrient uptake outer membrane protein [Flammeovirga agarivorans]|uniref:RagB/SusD family nutrient uptake outer membrane protein n=1 Tax=Flammeovirga agarivorans TaxID=2726742 RepID=A0A7X8SNH8_9BACT|nr:RagB/SusD family nutrient uptake outer membrane protein [Flammeovirga agarivorans]NLR93464.1 RagB/SusD family nutrient uptake outer membrane protein [Flammeovirga agarivorans]
MKLNNKIRLVLLLGTALFSSCSKYLEPDADNQLSPEQVWKDPDFAEGVLNYVYNKFPKSYDYLGDDILDCATDNAVSSQVGSEVRNMSLGGWNADLNPINTWNDSYQAIRNINEFLEYGLNEKYFDSTQYTNTIEFTYFDDLETDSLYQCRMYGEASFLRAFFNFQLLKNHAGKDENGAVLGVPIIDTSRPYSVHLPRNTYAECVDYILNDLDSAKKYLTSDYDSPSFAINNVGKANLNSAFALASKVALYAASPAFYDRTGGNTQSENWLRTAILSQEFIDKVGSLPAWDPDMFWWQNKGKPILTTSSSTNDFEKKNYPPSLNGKGFTNPTQNLVDAFPMENGYPITSELSNYDAENPYEGRDPRFYTMIIYNNAVFRGDSIETFVGGKDTEENYSYYTKTGYYLKKFVNPNISLTPGSESTDRHYYALFREVEAYLNYAEAANELVGPNAVPPNCKITAFEALKKVRERATLSDHAYLTEVASQGRDAFRELIHNERRIELAFESHRFYDLRRWEYNLDVINTAAQGIEITKGETKYSYQVIDVEERLYMDYMMYGPIPYDEIMKSNNIVQNKGW